VITEYLSWRWTLYINVPLAMAVALGVLRVLPDFPGPWAPMLRLLCGIVRPFSIRLTTERFRSSRYTRRRLQFCRRVRR
jgi:predicted MFS family arabinose efflux permease